MINPTHTSFSKKVPQYIRINHPVQEVIKIIGEIFKKILKSSTQIVLFQNWTVLKPYFHECSVIKKKDNASWLLSTITRTALLNKVRLSLKVCCSTTQIVATKPIVELGMRFYKTLRRHLSPAYSTLQFCLLRKVRLQSRPYSRSQHTILHHPVQLRSSI